MCGIIGYVGRKPAVPVLLSGLTRLEYRGYDSAGLAILSHRNLHVIKTPGRVTELMRRVETEIPSAIREAARVGIAHTRWATHGPPTEANAHPHLDASGRIAIVHNGIIENAEVLRRSLSARGHPWRSETDTEVLAHLIGACYEGDLLRAVAAAARQVQGTFGLAVMTVDHPHSLVVARRGSPLLIGLGAGETFVASDVAAFLAHTRQVLYLQDGEIAQVTAEGAEIQTLDHVPVAREVAHVDWDVAAAQKGGYPHFMLKEIYDQPEALANAMRGRLDLEAGTAVLSGLNLSPRELASVRRIVMVACGSSLHAAMVGKYAFEDLADVPAEAEQAAEYRYRNPIAGPDDLVIAISQSGETADTLAAAREALRKGALLVALCNVVGSTLAREAGRGLYLHAGPEISVASTKAFTCQLVVLLMMALKTARGRRMSAAVGRRFCEALQRVPDEVRSALDCERLLKRVAERYADRHDWFYLGRGPLYPIALEGALKLKEISYAHAEGYHAAELKHGPLALLDERVPVVALLTSPEGREKMISNVRECRARGAPIIGLLSADADVPPDLFEETIRLDVSDPFTALIPTAVALQLLAYHVARARGCSIDQPRHLAKSVTVE